MKFVSLPSIRSTVAQLISNASLAFALATFTGVASSPAWAEANLTPQQLDEEYEQNKLLGTQARDMHKLWSWRMKKEDSTQSLVYGTKTYSEYMRKYVGSSSVLDSGTKQRWIKKAIRIEKEYGHLSDEELEITYIELGTRYCLAALRLAEAGQKKALRDVVGGVDSSCGEITGHSLTHKASVRAYRIAMQIVHEGKWQVDHDILGSAHYYLARVYSGQMIGVARQDRDKTKYHLEKMKEAYGQACDAGGDGCYIYNYADDIIRRFLARFDKTTGEK
ncbi:hypothetical protein Q7381_08635 [Glaesserella parasuis]|nr:hypothetical protein [Glaesserella parasuis]MDP0120423.1 hypothetical protein [Glaesserella parasuis]